MTLLDHPLLASRYFLPRPGALEAAFFVVAADGQSRLGCFRSAPYDGARALTVLHFHGNAEIVPDYVPSMAHVMNDLGVNVVFAEYRGYGASTGAPSINAMLDDSESIFQALRVSASRVVAFGRSLGSIFALEVARRHPGIAGLILESAIAEPLDPAIVRVSAEDLGASKEELAAAVAERVDQRAKISGYAGPLLVMHTTADMLIPVTHAQRLFEWAGARPAQKKLVLFEQGDHGTIYAANREDYMVELGAFLDRVRRDHRTPRRERATERSSDSPRRDHATERSSDPTKAPSRKTSQGEW
ncbi:MAG TPA: alpha/beta hydrolase [Polyangiaceae bacterium]|nr:alpha/beta hydrolase [Polyangiaceae bacterium]